jgi:hypothetical protein
MQIMTSGGLKGLALAALVASLAVAGCATEDGLESELEGDVEIPADPADDPNSIGVERPPADLPPDGWDANMMRQADEANITEIQKVEAQGRWLKVRWPSAGVRRWNPSSCCGTVHCSVYAGQWVYWNGHAGGCSGGPCGNYVDIYVSTPCGFGGWVRGDAVFW